MEEKKRSSGYKRRAPEEAEGSHEHEVAARDQDCPVGDTQSAATLDECSSDCGGAAAVAASTAITAAPSTDVLSAALHEVLVSLFLEDREIRTLSGFP